MYKFKLFFIKGLKKLKLLKYFNFSTSITYREKNVNIPFIFGSGLPNFVLESDWLDSIINNFYNDNNSFVDVGVNIGQTLIKFKSIMPNGHYIGFEPNSACASYIYNLININGYTNCSVHNVALSENINILSLEKTSETDPRASVVAGLRPNFFQKKESILCVKYDDLFQDIPISFVKIDVEGGELEVIKGMKNSISKYRPIITCEVLDSSSKNELDFTQSRATQLYELINTMNYKIIRLHTNKNEILDIEKNDEIKIKLWTDESLFLNDYIFYPSEIENIIFDKLKK